MEREIKKQELRLPHRDLVFNTTLGLEQKLSPAQRIFVGNNSSSFIQTFQDFQEVTARLSLVIDELANAPELDRQSVAALLTTCLNPNLDDSSQNKASSVILSKNADIAEAAGYLMMRKTGRSESMYLKGGEILIATNPVQAIAEFKASLESRNLEFYKHAFSLLEQADPQSALSYARRFSQHTDEKMSRYFKQWVTDLQKMPEAYFTAKDSPQPGLRDGLLNKALTFANCTGASSFNSAYEKLYSCKDPVSGYLAYALTVYHCFSETQTVAGQAFATLSKLDSETAALIMATINPESRKK